MTTTTTSTKRKFSGTLNFPAPVKQGATALKRAGIDWTVTGEDLRTATGREGGQRWVQAIRDDNGEIIGVNGTRHEIIQNTALAEWGDTIIQMNAGFSYVGGGGFPNSDKTYLILAGERNINFGAEDDNGFNAVLLHNDFNGNSPLVATGFVGRPWCTNQLSGLARGRKKGSQRLVSVSHTASASWKIQAAKDVLREIVHEMDAVEVELQRMLEITMTEEQAVALAVGKAPDADAPARSQTTWEDKRNTFLAELYAPYNEHIAATQLGVVMAAQGVDEHLSRSADRDKARIDRLITANFPTMRKVLAGASRN